VAQARLIEPGFLEVLVPGPGDRRGGYLLAPGYAQKKLSPAALAKGHRYSNCFTYDFEHRTLELPAPWAIPVLEIRTLRSTLLADLPVQGDPEAHLVAVLSGTAADYLAERGIEPHPRELREWERRLLASEMLRSGSPDLIVAGVVEWTRTNRPVVRATTADRRRHQVTVESYNGIDPLLPRLSSCRMTRRHDIVDRG
jgi:hypothetical protein